MALALVCLASFPADATAPAQGGACTTGYTAAGDATGNNLICVSSVWQYTPYQFGPSSATCTSSTQAGTVQWTGSALQYCNGSNWLSISGSASGTVNSGTQYQLGYYATTTTAISGDSAITTDANKVLNVAGSTITTSDPALNVTQTWNASGVTFTGIVETITSTASAAASLLMNLKVGSTSEFSVDKSGDVTANGYVNAVSATTGYELNGTNAISFPTDTATNGTIAIGPGALATQAAAGSGTYQNVAVGYQAMGGGTMTTATNDDTAVGYQAGYTTNSTFSASVEIGYQAAYTAPNNSSVAIGYKAAYTAQNVGDVAIGYEALYTNSGGGNTAVGYYAGRYLGGGSGSNAVLGYDALATTAAAGTTNLTGGQHTAIGAYALQNAQGTAAYDTAVGYNAGGSITTGSNNVAIGSSVASTTLTTGSSNILIGTGSWVDTPAANTSNFISIGNLYEGDASLDHVVFNGTASTTLSAGCGSTAALSGNDNIGVITINGTGITTSCAVTFKNAWTTAPVCFAMDQTTSNLMRPVSATTTLTINGTLTAADKISYVCIGYQL